MMTRAQAMKTQARRTATPIRTRVCDGSIATANGLAVRAAATVERVLATRARSELAPMDSAWSRTAWDERPAGAADRTLRRAIWRGREPCIYRVRPMRRPRRARLRKGLTPARFRPELRGLAAQDRAI